MRLTLLLLAAVLAQGCGALKVTSDADGGGGGAGGGAGGGTAGSSGGNAGGSSGSLFPSAPCKPLVLDCLDPTSANVIEVPTESTMNNAVLNATANDVIQLRGVALGAGWRVPPYVTLRGCNGASIQGGLAFESTAGVVEGFDVPSSGSIVANQTGAFIVRQNRFTGGPASTAAAVSGRSIDGLVSASVTLLVEGNSFVDRSAGIEAATRYDTLQHAVDLTVRNNIFARVAAPVTISEGGLVGVVTAKLEHNTFYDFGTAISLTAVDRVTSTSGNLFVKGTNAVNGSAYSVAFSFAWDVTQPAGVPPISGSFAVGDPLFVDAGVADLRLSTGSVAVDAIPNGVQVPAEDYQGCPRPAGASGALPKADVGAYESQP